MESDPRSHQLQFALIQAGLWGEVNQGIRFMHELLEKLESAEAELKQTKLNLANECEARRRLEEGADEVKAATAELDRAKHAFENECRDRRRDLAAAEAELDRTRQILEKESAYRRHLEDEANKYKATAAELDQAKRDVENEREERQRLAEKVYGLRMTAAEVSRAKKDCEKERKDSSRLQAEVQALKDVVEGKEQRPFVVVLIDADADCYVFQDKFITNGEKGGQDAADALLLAVRQFVQESLKVDPKGMDILVRAFANLTGLGGALQRGKRLRDKDDLRAFTAGFSSRQAFFDFVDVGPGKERADLKVRESIEFFLESFQCKHLVLACAHDDGYAPCLGQLVGDRTVAERITLVEGSPFPSKMRSLGLRTTRLGSVFSNGKALEARSPPVAPAVLVKQPTSQAGTLSAADAATTAGERESNFEQWVSPWVAELPPGEDRSDRLGPVIRDKTTGRRIDRPLEIKKKVADRIRAEGLCYYLYLRGKCEKDCGRKHQHVPLTAEEFDALWHEARNGLCRNLSRGNGDCTDAKCVYGHRIGNHKKGSGSVQSR